MSAQSDKIIALALQRVRPADIAHQLCIDPANVHQCISSARKRGIEIPHFIKSRRDPANEPEPLAQQVVVPVRLFSMLATAAAAKGKTPSEMAAKLIENGLFGGVHPSMTKEPTL